MSSAEAHSPVKPSAIIAANVDLDSLQADDLEYNYDVAGLAGEWCEDWEETACVDASCAAPGTRPSSLHLHPLSTSPRSTPISPCV